MPAPPKNQVKLASKSKIGKPAIKSAQGRDFSTCFDSRKLAKIKKTKLMMYKIAPICPKGGVKIEKLKSSSCKDPFNDASVQSQ